MVQEKLNSLRPYVTGIRFVKNLSVVDVIIKEGWNIFESDTVSYKPSSTNSNYFMVFPKNPEDSIDVVLTHVEHVINVNIEKENKLVLLKAKIEELKQLFTNKTLTELEKLKFIFEEVSEPTLEDISKNVTNKGRHVDGSLQPTINKVELPPKEKSLNGKLEKEEN
tara:strand:+ start:95 stop:592 length:498 start_codon:yes stop_codon:yes gene_type:complete